VLGCADHRGELRLGFADDVTELGNELSGMSVVFHIFL
jgi:hypothetical protein